MADDCAMRRSCKSNKVQHGSPREQGSRPDDENDDSAARRKEERKARRRKEEKDAATKIQSHVRGWQCRHNRSSPHSTNSTTDDEATPSSPLQCSTKQLHPSKQFSSKSCSSTSSSRELTSSSSSSILLDRLPPIDGKTPRNTELSRQRSTQRIEPTSQDGDDVVDCEVHIDSSREAHPNGQLAAGDAKAAASDAQDVASDVRGKLAEYEDSKDDGATRIWPTPLTLQEHIDVSKESTADIAKRGTLRVFVMTWNLQAQRPPEDLGALLRPSAYHVYAIGTEECVRTIAKSVIFQSKKEWEDQLKATLGPEYTKLRSHALTAMHNVVFVHRNVFPLISHLHSDAIATGLGNQLGNKGGVGIAFNIGRTSFAFVGCHFEAHQSHHALQRRNANFHKINTELQLVDPTEDHRHGPITEAFDRVFWCGDLNYRIDGTRRMIDNLLERNFHDVLLVNDQLRKEMLAGRVFQRFREGPLHFRPTYKFDKGSDVYDSSPKQRIPSWTDRILFLSTTPKAIVQRAYESHMKIKTSDHRPVTAIFDVEFMTESTTHDKTALVGSDQTKSEVCCLQ